MNVYVKEYKKIEHRTRRRNRFALRYLPALLVITAAVVVGRIYIQAVALRWSRHVVELRELERDLELKNEDLSRAIAALTTRERVARDAGRKLGMVIPSGEEFVWLTILEHSQGDHTGRAADTDRGSGAAVLSWLDALWQEEALALTNR